MLTPFAAAQVGAVGAKLCYPDGLLQHAGAYLTFPRGVCYHIGWQQQDQGQYDTDRPCDMVTGAAIAVRMAALEQTGLFDLGYTPAYYEDADLCWRLRQHHYQIIYAHRARLVHHESLSLPDTTTRSRYYNRGRLRFVLKSYPVASLLGQFFTYEQRFLEETSHAQEDRALRWAYIESIAHLPALLALREPYHERPTANEANDIRDMLFALKDTLTQAAYRRAHRALGAIPSLPCPHP
jgi:GT2 family glycosyltransferase